MAGLVQTPHFAQAEYGDELHPDFVGYFGMPLLLTLPIDSEKRTYNFGSAKAQGTLAGGITTTPGEFGVLGAAWSGFNASSRYISTAYSGVLGTAARWLAIVFSTTSTTGAGTNSLISWGDNTGLTAGTIWDVDIENGVIWLRAGSGVTANWGSGYNNGKFHLLILTMKSGALCNQIECSVDGVSLSGTFASGTTAINTSSSAAVQIGRMTTNNNYFAGSVALAVIGGSYLPGAARQSLYSCLLTGEPFPLFQPRIQQRLMVNVTASGAFTQPLTAGLGFSTLLSRGVTHGFSGAVSFSGLQNRQISRSSIATLSFSGSTNKGTNHGLGGFLSFSGTVNRLVNRTVAGILSFSGSVNRGVSKSFAAALSFVGSIKLSVLKTFAAALSFVGSVGRTIVYKLVAILSFAASLSNGHAQQVNLAAVLSFTGNVNRGISKSLASALSFAGSVQRGIGKTFAAGLNFVGNVGRGISRGLSASLNFSASFANGTTKLLMKLRRWFSDE